jgi:alanyl-tRNA synthetase
LQAAVKTIRDTLPRTAVMLFAVDDAGKAMIHASVPDHLVAKGLKAGDWLKDAAGVMGGKGGGKPDNAQGGGPDGTKVREAMKVAEQAHRPRSHEGRVSRSRTLSAPAMLPLP